MMAERERTGRAQSSTVETVQPAASGSAPNFAETGMVSNSEDVLHGRNCPSKYI